MGDGSSPISVILVSSGSRGNKLLFRFPFQRGAANPAAQTGEGAASARRRERPGRDGRN
uniref:NPR3 like, GATOR1 complex subunit n=1 Tax=Anolis carolinensis TaxID=28377 RepID=A0A803T0Z1_ANOCA